MKSSRKLTLFGVAVLAALLTVGGSAEAHRISAVSGISSPLSPSCFGASGTQISLIAPCLDDLNHFFIVPLPIDSATSISVTRRIGTNGGTTRVGTVCSAVYSFNDDGTYFSNNAYTCTTNGPGTAVSIPTNGTALVNMYMSTLGGTTNQYMSYISYTP